MARQAAQISIEVAEMMRKNESNAITMRWPTFYKFCGRERIKGNFWAELKRFLREESILLVDGHAVVAFVKDFDFSPPERK